MAPLNFRTAPNIQGVQSQKYMTPNAKFIKFGGWARFDGSTQFASWKFAFQDETALVAVLEVMKAFGNAGILGARQASQKYVLVIFKPTSKSVVSLARVGQQTHRDTLLIRPCEV